MAQVLGFDPDEEMKWELVANLGHQVTSFSDAGEALDYAQSNKVDIALLSSPEGIDMIKHLREISPNFKVVLYSSSPSAQEVRNALRWAPCSFLFKPIVAQEVDACLKRALLKGKSAIKIPLNI
ncbi:MAG: response regulator [Deltaproteobacteria bacterium]|nr:response regulator [Deltaproteobacteria bacterium]